MDGRRPGRRAAASAYVTDASGRVDGRLDAMLADRRTAGKNTSNEYDKKHG